MQTSRTGRCSSAGGFTLAELVIVLTIIAVMTGLVIPYLPGVGEDGLRTATRRLSGMLGEARNEALMTGAAHGLMLDMEKGAFWLERLEALPGEPAAERPGQQARRPLGAVRTLPSGLTLAQVAYQDQDKAVAGVASIRIQADGMAEPAVIGLASGSGSFSLRIRPFDAGLDLYRGLNDFETLAEAELLQ